MIKYIFLGLTQGLTEFLPVSSSGHLAIMQRLLGISGQEVALSVILHLGTLAAMLIFFFKDILKLFGDLRKIFLILIVTVITGTIGILGKDFFEGLFSSPKLIALAWIITGIMLILTRKSHFATRKDVGPKDAGILGLVQGMAIIPGLSRSGVTISTLLFRGLDRETSFKFSFLASIPAVLGAAILEGKDISFVFKAGPVNLLAGFSCSLIAGLSALVILRVVLAKAKLYYFGYYCVAIAIITLLFIR